MAGYPSIYGDAIVNPFTDMQIERLYEGISGLASQDPTGLGANMDIQFGAVQGTASDPIQTLAQGGDTEASILRINEAGLYRIQTQLGLGRDTASGTAIMNLRVLINSFQAGRTVQFRLANSNVTYDWILEAWLNLPAGLDLIYQVQRDAAGNNSGSLIKGTVSDGTWNGTTCASLRVERWKRS